MDFDTFYLNNRFGKEHSVEMAEYITKYAISPCYAVDLGAGEGRNSVYLATLDFRVVAIEPSVVGARKISQQSKERNLGIIVENTDFLSCANKLKDVGFLVAFTSLEHMEYNYLLEAVKTIKQILKIGGYVYIVVFTEDDPGFKNETEMVSECASHIKHYFRNNELRDLFSDFEILHYSEFMIEDTDHGPIHYHGEAELFAQKIG